MKKRGREEPSTFNRHRPERLDNDSPSTDSPFSLHSLSPLLSLFAFSPFSSFPFHKSFPFCLFHSCHVKTTAFVERLEQNSKCSPKKIRKSHNKQKSRKKVSPRKEIRISVFSPTKVLKKVPKRDTKTFIFSFLSIHFAILRAETLALPRNRNTKRHLNESSEFPHLLFAVA